jgi:rod shape-determining protein MreD
VSRALRFCALGFATVILQVVAASQLQLFGATADLVPLAVAAVALLCGPVAGAGFGFGLGLFLDLSLFQTVGLSSLLYVALGYGVARFRELRPDSPLTAILVGAMATLVAGLGYSTMQFLIGVDAPLSVELLRDIATTALVNAIIATPVFAGVRWVLEPVLPEDTQRRRRRARRATTTRLTPLQRA